MEPRLKSSKKWTAFPKEYTEQILKVFGENFAPQLGQDTLTVEGRIYTTEVVLRVGIRRVGQLKQPNFEVSMDYSPVAKDAIERIHNCIDAAASMMLDYLEDEDVDFPKAWKPFPFQDVTVYLRFSTVNTELEDAAARLLGEDAEGLVKEEAEPEDALAVAEIDEELSGGHKLDDEDDQGPRMFRGPAKKKLH